MTTAYTDTALCPPRAGTLYDVLELILDRGMVIDVFIRVSLVGIEILKIDARIVVASVDTYLRFAEVCNRLDLESDPRSSTVPELFGGGRSLGKRRVRTTAGMVGDTMRRAVGADDKKGGRRERDGHDECDEERRPKSGRRAKAHSGLGRRHSSEG